MFYSITIGNRRFIWSIRHVGRMEGACSELDGGNHMLMWDFDDVPLNRVVLNLKGIQLIEDLPRILIFESKPGANYQAYCWCRMPFPQAVSIVAKTNLVDWNFVAMSAVKGFFTLRYTPKNGNTPKLVRVLGSKYPENCAPSDMKAAHAYHTRLDKGR